jgi:hypothetical protein
VARVRQDRQEVAEAGEVIRVLPEKMVKRAILVLLAEAMELLVLLEPRVLRALRGLQE